VVTNSVANNIARVAACSYCFVRRHLFFIEERLDKNGPQNRRVSVGL